MTNFKSNKKRIVITSSVLFITILSVFCVSYTITKQEKLHAEQIKVLNEVKKEKQELEVKKEIKVEQIKKDIIKKEQERKLKAKKERERKLKLKKEQERKLKAKKRKEEEEKQIAIQEAHKEAMLKKEQEKEQIKINKINKKRAEEKLIADKKAKVNEINEKKAANNQRDVANNVKNTTNISGPSGIKSQLLSAGLNAPQVQAIMKNLNRESSFNPSADNHVGNQGLAQWGGARLSNLKRSCGGLGSSSCQINFMLNEMNNGINGFNMNTFKSFSDSNSARSYFKHNYEGAA